MIELFFTKKQGNFVKLIEGVSKECSIYVKKLLRQATHIHCMNASDIPWYSLSEKSELALILFIIPIISCLVCAVSLFSLYGTSCAKQNLGWLLMVVSLFMLAYFISDYCFYSDPYAIMRFFDTWSGLVIAPFTYLYFASLIHPHRSHKKAMLLWLLPAVVFLIAYILVLVFGTEYAETYTWEQFLDVIFYPEPLLRALALPVFAFEIGLACFYVYSLSAEYRSNIMHSYSYMEKINLNWVTYIAVLLASFGAVAILGIVTGELIYKLLFSFYTFVVMFVIYILGMKQEDVPETDMETSQQQASGSNADDTTIEKTALLIKRIDQLLGEEEIFLDANLSTKMLADKLNTNRTYISNAINKERDLNFYQYINAFRIKYAIKLLSESRNGKCTSHLVEECGFKSASTFYAFFKEHTGFTPKEYSMKRGKSGGIEN